MTNLRKSEHQLIPLARFIDDRQQNRAMLQVQILRLQLKEEKLRDKIVYQSIKDKIFTQ